MPQSQTAAHFGRHALAGMGRLKIGDDDLPHFVHGLERPLRLLAVGIADQSEGDLGADLPIDAEFVA